MRRVQRESIAVLAEPNAWPSCFGLSALVRETAMAASGGGIVLR